LIGLYTSQLHALIALDVEVIPLGLRPIVVTSRREDRIDEELSEGVVT